MTSSCIKKVPERWINCKGEGVVISVIDTGYSPHEDLEESVVAKNSVLYEEFCPFDYANGHGNMCMGIIAAQKTNLNGIEGIAPKARLISIKAIKDSGETNYNNLIKGIYLSVALNVDVISISSGGYSYSHDLELAIKYCYDNNTPVVCAAGNDGHVLKLNKIQYPAKFKETICVGSISKDREISKFSAIGQEIDFVAVGEKIKSTNLNNTYEEASGTSFSAPYITGVVALLLSKHKIQENETGKNDCKTVDEIKEHLRKHTVDLGERGKDVFYGYGAIDVKSIFSQKNNSLFSRIKDFLTYLFR